ncbi:hypothetical protein NE852_01645 (plasmid) [Rhizobium sp. Pop5]|jgi:hypothetical protein|uniref:Uncharacterized protein n=4 Tax=Rhizobium/Agrobacterium group TaxID=227290 RepID=A0A192TKU2_9HYPH|nr:MULTISPECIES: hypothetical protein [Rhizobium]UWU38989.1 hypothetical protein N2597_32150 [Rhizobium leguminosarum bv. phaseoli]ANK88527.1 hypothetical protein AMK02_PC00291 [Rhizobium sp. N731]ANK94316.1 hypothetical protein AMK01_PB00299 [Rhizobium sp. N6212]ANL00366.1 hypothetical protein AMK00_PB00298 [Rhizobium sp. N621]ANL06488.1 hypothetical protein AMJ99_PB00291 [Rhizobium esperanzae]
MGEMIVAHDIRHGLKANQQVRTDGLRRMGTYKTAYFLLQKLREAADLRRDAIKLHGTVQIDGKYVGGVLRKVTRRKSARTGARRKIRTASVCEFWR